MSKENEIISKVFLSIEKFKGNFQSFKDGILRDEYSSKKNYFSRTLLWKTCLMTETLNIQSWRSKLISCRSIYHELTQRSDMIVPWDTLDHESEFFLESPSLKASFKAFDTNFSDVKFDPLNSPGISGHSEQRLESIAEDADLLNSIILDVHRLFPGDLLFHGNSRNSLKHRRQVIRLLFIWSKLNSQIGYKQGMHEVLGLLFKNLVHESLEISHAHDYSLSDLEILSLYDKFYFEHDLFCLFNRFLVSSGFAASFYQSEASLIKSIQRFNGLLMKVDQHIHFNLITQLKLETQLWAIRYFRLLLLRELGNDTEGPSVFWDKLVSVETSDSSDSQYMPDIIKFAVIILLIHVKTELSLCDFAEALSLLLHYPISSRLHLYPDFLQALFNDALHLSRLSDDDRKLYEYGLQLNKKYVNIRIAEKISFGSGTPLSQSVQEEKSRYSQISGLRDQRKLDLASMKSKLEARLKRAAQTATKR